MYIMEPLSVIDGIGYFLALLFFISARLHKDIPGVFVLRTDDKFVTYLIFFTFFSMLHEVSAYIMTLSTVQPDCETWNGIMSACHLLSWFPFLAFMLNRAEIACDAVGKRALNVFF